MLTSNNRSEIRFKIKQMFRIKIIILFNPSCHKHIKVLNGTLMTLILQIIKDERIRYQRKSVKSVPIAIGICVLFNNK